MEFSEYIWVAIGAIWIVSRILPRLFRAAKKKAAEQMPAPTAGEEPQIARYAERQQEQAGTDFRPIEPR